MILDYPDYDKGIAGGGGAEVQTTFNRWWKHSNLVSTLPLTQCDVNPPFKNPGYAPIWMNPGNINT